MEQTRKSNTSDQHTPETNPSSAEIDKALQRHREVEEGMKVDELEQGPKAFRELIVP